MKNAVVSGETVRKVRLCGRTIAVDLPEEFHSLQEKEMIGCYPEGECPQAVFQEKDGTRFTFSYFMAPLTSAQLPSVESGLKKLLAACSETEEMYDSAIECKNGTSMGLFDYKSRENGESCYNILCIAEIGGNTLCSAFSCKYACRTQWEDMARYAISTIRDLTGQEA